MRSPCRMAALTLLAVSIAAGTVADGPLNRDPLTIGGYHVVAADLHTHSSWSNGSLTPWGLVLEARRQGLDAIAITGHNKVYDSRVGRWFGRLSNGPTVLTGQEIQTAASHVIALGIERVVDWRQDVSEQIDAVHGQGGVAIAAHPFESFWSGFDSDAIARLDGAEICHPTIYLRETAQAELEQFAQVAEMAAIGSSDFHGVGRLGMCRTYVFSRDSTAEAIIEALREHRTVVYGVDGVAYGEPVLVEMAARHPELRDRAVYGVPAGWMDWLSRFSGVAGLLMLVLFQREP